MGLDAMNYRENCNGYKKINRVLLQYLILKDKGKVVSVHAMKAWTGGAQTQIHSC